MEKAISKELISHLVLLESDHQELVLSYIKKLLGATKSSAHLNLIPRAEASEREIASGRIKKAAEFKRKLIQWQKKKRADMKL